MSKSISDEKLAVLWNLLNDHFDTDLLSDKDIDRINDTILKLIVEARIDEVQQWVKIANRSAESHASIAEQMENWIVELRKEPQE